VSRPSRRLVLAASIGAGILAGCTPSPPPSGARSPSPTPSRSPTPPPDPDLPLLRRSLASERLLAATIVATSRRYPAVAKALAPYAARHQRHLAALSPAAPSPTATPSASPSPALPVVPAKQNAALAALVKAEREAQLVHHAALRTVSASGNALLLASLAACAAAHAAALVELNDAD
jgi:hypothetical protein